MKYKTFFVEEHERKLKLLEEQNFLNIQELSKQNPVRIIHRAQEWATDDEETYEEFKIYEAPLRPPKSLPFFLEEMDPSTFKLNSN